MSTIGSLLALMDPGIVPYNQQELTEQRIRGGMLQNQTSLLALEEARRQQQAEAAYRQAVQQHPGLLFGGGGQQPLLAQLSPGALPQTGGPPGAITQQAFGPSGPGAAQTIPAPMDLSRFATGTPPPGAPVLASVGQPQGPVGGAQATLMQLARENPDAALLLQGRMQQQQDRQWKLQEQQLTMREKVAGYIARNAQTIRSQADLDRFRRELQQAGLASYASQLPEWYSEAAMAPLITSAQSALENAQTALANAQAAKSQQQTLTEQYTREVMLPRLMQRRGVAPEGAPEETTVAGGPAVDTSRLAPAFVQKMGQVEQRLGMQSGDLGRLIHFETGGTFDPAVKNRAGSGATGLIQFMPDTAKALGTTPQALAQMTPEQQLDYVEKYLAPYKGRIGNLQDAYMAVLYPEAIGKGSGYRLFTREGTPAAYRQNAGLDTTGKGYVTVGDAVAAVQRTTGARPEQPAGTQAAAARSPKLQRITQEIAALEDEVRMASITPGMNVYADNLSKQLDRLYKERDREEELPRKVREQEALLPGQKAVARAGEETRAEMERAPREEIDAINRGLPPESRIPYGTTREEIRKKGLVGGIPIPEKGNEELIARSTIVQQLGQLKTTFGDLPTGPLQARLNQYREMLGIDLKDEAVAYSTLLNTVRNRVVNALSGAAVSPDEAKRILAELPNEKTSPQAFKGRLETALKIAEDVYKRRAQYYRRSGHSVPESLMTPYWDEPLPGATGSGAAAAKPSSNVDDFKNIRR